MLVQKLDGLPLALATAGYYLRQVTTSFADYLRLYEKAWLRLQRRSPQLTSYDHSLETTWELSLENVRKHNPLSEKLLQFWAYFDNQDIWFQLLQKGRTEGPQWLLEATQDKIEFDWTMRALCEHGLVTQNSKSPPEDQGSRGYSIHGCVHDWTIHVLNEGMWDRDTLKLALFCLRHNIPTNAYGRYRDPQSRLVRHAVRCRELLEEIAMGEDDSSSIADCMQFLGNLFYDQNNWVDAEEMFRRALERRDKDVAGDHGVTEIIA